MKLSLAGPSASPGISLKGNGKGKQPASSTSTLKKASISKGKGRAAAFGDDDDDDDGAATNAQGDEAISAFDKLHDSKGKSRTSNGNSNGALAGPANPSRRLAKLHSEASALDPSVFLYDEVYDTMKSASLAASSAKKGAAQEQEKPKYVSGLLKAAEQRKRDRVRAEDKLIEREREREGDEFADKDRFVTQAYKEQQEELRKAEEEERIKEEQAAKRPGGMSAYYQRELAAREAVHAAAVAATSSTLAANPADSGVTSASGSTSTPLLSAEAAELAAHGPRSEASIAAEASQSLGRTVQLNTEGQIVDKRELLTGGLNLKPRRTHGPASGPPGSSEAEADAGAKGGFSLSIAERKRALDEIERKEAERKAREDEQSVALTGLTMKERQMLSRERQSKEMMRQLEESQARKRKEAEEREATQTMKRVRRNNDETKVEELKRKAHERRQKAKEDAEKAAALPGESAS